MKRVPFVPNNSSISGIVFDPGRRHRPPHAPSGPRVRTSQRRGQPSVPILWMGMWLPVGTMNRRLLYRDLAHQSPRGAFELADYAKRRRIELDAGETQAGHVTLDPDAIGRLLEGGQRAVDALERG